VGMLRQIVTAAFGFAAMTAVASVGAQAQTSISLVTGGTITDNGYTITLSTCSYTVPGVSSGSCNASTAGSPLAGDVLEAVDTGHDVSFVLVNSSGGPVLSISNPSSSKSPETADIDYTVLVTQTSATKRNITSVSAAVQGTSSTLSNPYSQITIGGNVSCSTCGGSGIGLSSNQTTGVVGPITFSPTQQILLSEDLDLTAPPGTSLTLNNNPTNAPEPATLTVLGSAVLALVKTRKSRKRRRTASV
jgi:hypothetical protein